MFNVFRISELQCKELPNQLNAIVGDLNTFPKSIGVPQAQIHVQQTKAVFGSSIGAMLYRPKPVGAMSLLRALASHMSHAGAAT